MKPVALTMTAFGSFAEETCVRFDEFQSGLYLVVGETGAGKTTVFDAIVFALFGTASGSERVRLQKQLAKIQGQIEELQKYEEKIHHLADQAIPIDLDDGVKVNYAKFEDVLAKIK